VDRTPHFVITDYQFPTLEAERNIISEAGGLLSEFQCKSEDQVITATKDADAVLVQWAPITRAVIQNMAHCKVIVRYGIGLDNVDIEAARQSGIMIRNVPDYCIEEVADHTFALAVSLLRQLHAIDKQIREGIWKIVPPRPMLASRQATFVTVGYGRIARAVLDRARACKFKLATCDPCLPTGFDLPFDIPNLSLDETIERADILCLNLPLSRDTKHLLNAARLSTMKRTALLVNTARGGLVDTVALAAALESGQIAGAGLDVFEEEPLPENHPLRKCPNVVLTSHVSWYSELSGPTLQRMAAEEAVKYVLNESSQAYAGS
jgi:D-3-phosphoglycerate dehydrogenase